MPIDAECTSSKRIKLHNVVQKCILRSSSLQLATVYPKKRKKHVRMMHLCKKDTLGNDLYFTHATRYSYNSNGKIMQPLNEQRKPEM